MGIEETINNSLNTANAEKSFIDKVLGRRDVEKIGALMKRQDLSRSELNDLLYSIISIETKLVNLDDYERYVFGKYFVWIREFVKNTELIYDLKDRLEKTEHNETLSEHAIKKSLEQTQQTKILMEHSIKFSIDILMYLLRSSLSLNGTTLDKLSTNRYEYTYESATPLMPTNNK